MKWFQHDTNASHDAKIKKLIIRHGAIGYAVYFHCLELIAGDISQNNITFELEHDTEIIADNLKIIGDSNESGIDKVNRIMKDIINLGLFQMHNDKVFCFKLAKRLDNTISRSAEINKIKQLCSNNEVTTKQLRSDDVAEENRIDKNRLDEIKTDNNKRKSADYTNTDTLNDFISSNNLTLNSIKTDALIQWLEYKKELKQSYKPTGLKALIKDIATWTDTDFTEAVTASMRNGWKGLFKAIAIKQKKSSGYVYDPELDGMLGR